MPRHKDKARRQYYRKLNRRHIAKVLGIKPWNLTKKLGYDSKLDEDGNYR
jgi:hypothetical protein